MDYSHAAYFAGAPAQAPYHQFPLNITPLTPSHSNSAGSDDFNNTSPPVSLAARASLCSPSHEYLYMMRLLKEPAFTLSSPCQACQTCLALQPTLLAAASCWTRGTSEGLHIPYSGCLRPLPRRTVPELRSICHRALQHTTCTLPGATDATESTSCRPQRPVAPRCAPRPQWRCPRGQAPAAGERPAHDEVGT